MDSLVELRQKAKKKKKKKIQTKIETIEKDKNQKAE